MRRYLEIEHLFKLSLAVYRVTAIFPVGGELGAKIRDLADNILANLLWNEKCSRSIGEILGLFDLAEKKNLADPRNFLVLRREYDKIRQSAVKGENSGKTVENSLPHNGNGNVYNNHRQEKILEIMNGNGMVKIGDLIKLFPGINRRTVLRDLDKLCQVGAVVRNGNGRGAHYLKNGLNGSNTSP